VRFTGTFLGGPYDGEIRDYDLETSTGIIWREDPLPEINQFGIPTEAPMAATYQEPRMYEWRQDDDGRGWWVPMFPRR